MGIFDWCIVGSFVLEIFFCYFSFYSDFVDRGEN